MDDPRLPRCSARTPLGPECESLADHSLPLLICEEHATLIYRHMRVSKTFHDMTSDERADVGNAIWKAMREFSQVTAPIREADRNERLVNQSLVYYVRAYDASGEYVKIGVTSNMKARLSALRVPEGDLLATEPGLRDLEAERHRQFAHLYRGRFESFTPGPDLLDWIEQVRATHGYPKVTSWA